MRGAPELGGASVPELSSAPSKLSAFLPPESHSVTDETRPASLRALRPTVHAALGGRPSPGDPAGVGGSAFLVVSPHPPRSTFSRKPEPLHHTHSPSLHPAEAPTWAVSPPRVGALA